MFSLRVDPIFCLICKKTTRFFAQSEVKKSGSRMPIDRTSHLTAQKPDKSGRHRSFYHTFIQFLCSNIGLILVVIGYSIGGAFLFILLEQYIELQNCQQANCKSNISTSNNLHFIAISIRKCFHFEYIGINV